MDNSDLDLIVIGAGPGGYVAAERAARRGMRVACVEKEALGGTCLNVGCIPSKALLESSELYARLRKGLGHHGIQVGPVTVELDPLMARKERIVKAMTSGVAVLLKRAGVLHVRGTARIAASGSVMVTTTTGDETLRAPRILVATGSVPVELRALPFAGQRIITSTRALALEQVPDRLAVIGAGAIGLELGSVWSRLGAQVTVIEYMDQILPGMDAEMAGQLQRLLKRQGLDIYLRASAQGAETGPSGVNLCFAQGEVRRQLEVDRILVAVGRRPYTGGLGLEELGLTLDERGRIPVDAGYRTAVEGIYAIGDVIAGPMLAHKAEADAVAAVEGMAGAATRVDYASVPGVVYTHPELASVGLSEDAARAEHGDVRVGRHLFRANARAHCMDQVDGLVKVVAHARTGRLLGVHILGPQASQLIAEAALAVRAQLSAEDLARTVHAHPTLPEVIREAAWAACGGGPSVTGRVTPGRGANAD